jgi:hypothetical protein
MSWSPSVDELIESLDLIGAEQGTDRRVQLALFGVEPIASLAVHLLELRAMVFKNLAELCPLRRIELQIVRQPSCDRRGHACRTLTAAAAPEWRPFAPAGRRAPSVGQRRQAAIVRERWHVASKNEATRSSKAEDGEHEQRKPDPGTAIGHRRLREDSTPRRAVHHR